MKRFLIGLVALFAFVGCQARNDVQNKLPNVVFIYADDLGRGMLSHEGQQIVKTPNIDHLAAEGVRFSNVRGCMFCAPARASLLTGYHDCHADKWKITSAGVYKKVFTGNVTADAVSQALEKQVGNSNTSTITMAEVFKKAGYTTGQVGKLEWGFAVSFEEMKQHGWDYYYGYLDHVMAHGFYPPYMFENGNKIEIPGNTRQDCGKTLERETPETFKNRWNMEGKKEYSQNLFLDKMLAFIRENKDRPFFLFHPTQLPHGPVAIPEVHPDFKDDKRLTQIEKEYASMVKMLDDHVGIILKELKKLGLEKNTIVIFSSDNGHEIYYSQEGRILKPVRNMQTGEKFDNVSTKFYSELGGDVFNGNDGMAGLKYDNWEGGYRVPLIVKWPGVTAENEELDNLVANYDLLPTFADLLNVKLTKKKDGLSILPLITGENTAIEHDYTVNASMYGGAIVTKDGWKLRNYYSKNIFQLYYLPDDYKEEFDLADKYPEKVEELKAILKKECNEDLANGYFSYQKFILPGVKVQP
ncbi:arylsulfatase [Prolixibacteraceae bacterium Z1-6]|uniref:Arylsulfatase n=1 Tax=Draconibacterium aestuarii TaxID=2998507 RepID=A0A9X3F1E2_9BACT|nr:arylsulfatase [Prolixibacteraceae bacterium Z1-6]